MSVEFKAAIICGYKASDVSSPMPEDLIEDYGIVVDSYDGDIEYYGIVLAETEDIVDITGRLDITDTIYKMKKKLEPYVSPTASFRGYLVRFIR